LTEKEYGKKVPEKNKRKPETLIGRIGLEYSKKLSGGGEVNEAIMDELSQDAVGLSDGVNSLELEIGRPQLERFCQRCGKYSPGRNRGGRTNWEREPQGVNGARSFDSP